MQADGLILAGGKSSRMGGRHKGGLSYGGETFTHILIKEFQLESEKIWLSYGREPHEAYEHCHILTDIYPNCGPIGGLHAGLSACEQDWMMVAACDMPLLRIELFRFLYRELERAGEACYAGAVPVNDGRIHPLAAIYRRTIVNLLEKQIENGSLRLRDALERMDILYVDVTEYPAFTRMLRNINTVEEYKNFIEKG